MQGPRPSYDARGPEPTRNRPSGPHEQPGTTASGPGEARPGAGGKEDTGPGGTYARLAELGHEPVHFREEIRSRMPSKDEAAELRVSAGTPVILVCRTAYAAEGHAVEVNEMTLDAASYVLEYDFDAGR